MRGDEIAMIFQDPLSSLHPFYKIGDQLVEAVRAHRDVSQGRRRCDRAVEMLGLVGIPDPRRRVDSYPHEFSGGMRQRVMIAMALINDPKLLIADEPTTALDVTVQAQILELIERLQSELDTAVVLITHDLGVVAEVADEIAVMYAGPDRRARARATTIFAAPEHPYTWGLLRSIPRLDTPRDEELVPIPGPPAVADPRARRAARSIRAARTCSEAHKRDRPAARAGPTATRATRCACLLPSRATRTAALWRDAAAARAPEAPRGGRAARGAADGALDEPPLTRPERG